MHRYDKTNYSRSDLVDVTVYNNIKTELYHSFSDEDISVLKHHGILGMKWGVRRYQNEDGTLTEEGKRRYGAGARNPKNVEKARNIYLNSRYNEDVSDKVLEAVNADTSSLNKVRDDIKVAYDERIKQVDKFDKLYSELKNDKNVYTKYCVESELATGGVSPDKMTLEDMGWSSYMALFEDGQQGIVNAYSLYNYDHGLQKKTSDIYNKISSIDRNIKDSASKIIQSELDKVGGENLTTNKNNNYKLSEALVRRMMIDRESIADKEGIDTTGYYWCEEANNVDGFTDGIKNDIKSAKKYISKIKNNDKESTWWVFNEAVRNLGLDQNTLSNLSDSDWNKINEEIANLKKRPRSVPSSFT